MPEPLSVALYHPRSTVCCSACAIQHQHGMLTCTQARQALTGALKIWWDQSQKNKHNNEPDWQPALLPSVFAGAKAAAMTRNVDPNQVLAVCHVCRCFGLCETHVCRLLAAAIGLYCTDVNNSHSTDCFDAKAQAQLGNAMGSQYKPALLSSALSANNMSI